MDKKYFIDTYLKEYLKNKCQMKEILILITLEHLNLHEDIKIELYISLIYGFFPKEEGIKVCGYNAQELSKAKYLSIIAAYNYLIYLRQDPVNALAELKE